MKAEEAFLTSKYLLKVVFINFTNTQYESLIEDLYYNKL